MSASRINISSWTKPFPHKRGVAVVFDIFRCSTTIHSLFARNLGPVFVAESLVAVRENPRLESMRVFSELSQKVSCAERFDNSPESALESPWLDRKESLVATTTGTPAMFAAHNAGFETVYVGALVNFTALVQELSAIDKPITLIPAAFPEYKHVEDEIACMAVARALEGFANIPEFVRECAELAKTDIIASGRPAYLTEKLPTGAADTRIAMEIDRFPEQILRVDFAASPQFAAVLGS